MRRFPRMPRGSAVCHCSGYHRTALEKGIVPFRIGQQRPRAREVYLLHRLQQPRSNIEPGSNLPPEGPHGDAASSDEASLIPPDLTYADMGI